MTSPSKLPNKALVLSDSKQHLLLCASGSVATIKIPSIVKALASHTSLSIRIILTASAAKFLGGQSEEQPSLSSIIELPNVDAIYQDEDEWDEPWVRGNKILHIELRRWADIMVIAPLSANTLAKMAGGLCDNLLLSTLRAWDTTGMLDPARENVSGQTNSATAGERRRKIILVAPAMNTAMYLHPLTKKQLSLLGDEWGVQNGGWIEVLAPVEKEIACGDIGIGGMREWREIVEVIEDRMGLTDISTSPNQ